jgi:MarR family 2-MHQ and catechol resistance regulon transcriptional repressor
MKAIDRKAAEFRALQEAVIARLRNVDLTAMGALSTALTVQEFRSLEFLAVPELRKTKDLAAYLGLAVNSVTDVVDSLEKKELVRRRRDPSDRRIVRIELTDAGRVAADIVARGHLEIYRTYLRALTPDEQDTLLALYRKIARLGRPAEIHK